jgi:hypothetical protein
MRKDSTESTCKGVAIKSRGGEIFVGGNWFDPLEAGVRERIHRVIDGILESELDAALGRDRYERPEPASADGSAQPTGRAGYLHGHRERRLLGTFGVYLVPHTPSAKQFCRQERL